MLSSSPYSSEADPTALPAPKEVYARIVEHLQPNLMLLGYSAGKTKGFPWWYAENSPGRVFVSAQVDTKATDPYAGSGFRLELERGSGGAPNSKLVGRALFFQLLTDDELEALLRNQNQVIAALSPPPEGHTNAYPEFLRPQYLSYFQPQDSFDAVKSWMRYRDLNDVDRWIELLTPLLPAIDRRARENLKSDQTYLGRGRIALD